MLTCPIQAQEGVRVLTKNGLNIRKGPNLSSEVIGILPYGYYVELVEKTDKELSVVIDGTKIKGNWAKINFSNGFEIVAEQNSGYVFDAFLGKNSCNYECSVRKIDEKTFLLLKKDAYKNKSYRKIDDFEKI